MSDKLESRKCPVHYVKMKDGICSLCIADNEYEENQNQPKD